MITSIGMDFAELLRLDGESEALDILNNCRRDQNEKVHARVHMCIVVASWN